MALSKNSKIVVSDITTALNGKQNALGYTPVKTVNGSGVDGNGNVSITYVDSCNYANSAGQAYPMREGGVRMYMNWNGQGGQPTWLWGGEDGTNMYVYNPANFNVNYANSAGYAKSAGYANSANASVLNSVAVANKGTSDDSAVGYGGMGVTSGSKANFTLPSGGTWRWVGIVGMMTYCGQSSGGTTVISNASYGFVIAIRIS